MAEQQYQIQIRIKKFTQSTLLLNNNFIKMSKLENQQTRFFEYLRPRYSNPTYSSQNMGASLFPLPSASHYLSQARHRKSQSKLIQVNTDKLQKVQSSKKSVSSRKSQKSGSNHEGKCLYSNNIESHLSNYGSSSLGKLPKYYSQQITPYNSPGSNDVEIYEKQTRKYNIITMQPKAFSTQTIKKYPKYHLENLDQNFYKKLMLEDQYKSSYQQQPKINNAQKIKNSSNSYNAKYYRDVPANNQHFRAKMLNNVDELGGMV